MNYARIRLAQWGRWSRGLQQTGYPRCSAFVRAGEGERSKRDVYTMPVDVEEVELAVKNLNFALKTSVIGFYVLTGSLALRAVKLKISRRTLMRRVCLAEIKINQILNLS